MPLKISSSLRNSIAEQNNIDRDAVIDTLIDQSGQKCWLCDGDLNIAAEDIEVDHDVPVDAGGTESLSNLHLAHAECNRFKRANNSKDVRNILRFKRFYNEKGGALDYTKSLEFFDVTPKKTKLDITIDLAKFQFPDGSKESVPIYRSLHNGTEFQYCFVSVPSSAVYNDNECQPRLIKLNHAFSIAGDLATNPLHEAPAARIEHSDDGLCRILMFDGQHKAVANWLRYEKRIVYKIYLNINRGQATTLVNSIQSKIKKLPLTPFELASKLSDEYSDKIALYETAVGTENVSEEGFVEWLPAANRSSARREIEAAVLKDIADDNTLTFTEIVEMRGRIVGGKIKITETTFQNKMLKELAYTKPLPKTPYNSQKMQTARANERQNIVRILNLLYEKVFAHLDDSSSALELERANRMVKQVSLLYVAKVIKKIVNNRVVPTSEEFSFVEKIPNDDQWAEISKAIDRLVNHPVWTAAFNSSPEMQLVEEALSKNQNEVAFQQAGFTPGYCVQM